MFFSLWGVCWFCSSMSCMPPPANRLTTLLFLFLLLVCSLRLEKLTAREGPLSNSGEEALLLNRVVDMYYLPTSAVECYRCKHPHDAHPLPPCFPAPFAPTGLESPRLDWNTTTQGNGYRPVRVVPDVHATRGRGHGRGRETGGRRHGRGHGRHAVPLRMTIDSDVGIFETAGRWGWGLRRGRGWCGIHRKIVALTLGRSWLGSSDWSGRSPRCRFGSMLH